MRVLWIPMWDKAWVLKNSSEWNWGKVLVKVLSEEGHYLYILVPEGVEVPNEYVGRYTYVPTSWDRVQSQELCNPDFRALKPFRMSDGPIVIDAVLNDKVMANSSIRAYLEDTNYNLTGRLVNAVELSYVFGAWIQRTKTPAIMKAQSYGISSADIVLWNDSYQFDAIYRDFRKFLSVTEVSRIRENSLFGVASLDPERVMKYRVEKSRDVVRFNYANGMNADYQYERIFDCFDFLFRLGKKVEVIATIPDPQVSVRFMHLQQKGGQWPELKIYLGLSQEEFYKVAATCHVGMFLGRGGEINGSIPEQQLLGQVIVFVNNPFLGDWVYEGYPYVARNNTELKMWLKFLAENYWTDEVQGVLAKQQQFVLERQNDRKSLVRLSNEMKRQFAEQCQRTGMKSIYAALSKYLEGVSELSYDGLVEAVKNCTDKGIPMHRPYGRMRLDKLLYHRFMYRLGFVDTCESPVPFYRRVG